MSTATEQNHEGQEVQCGSASNSTQLLYGGHCSVPRDIAVCPECGGTLHADVIGWDAETGLPDICHVVEL